jgi:hypothetical protein
VLASVVFFAALTLGAGPANAQARDGLLNGAIIGAAVGAGAGVAFTHAVRDSDLSVGQYAYGGLIFGAIGAGVGLGIDALLDHALPGGGVLPRRLVITPAAGRHAAGLIVRWRW